MIQPLRVLDPMHHGPTIDSVPAIAPFPDGFR
jgi:hypothetical protein